MGDSQDKKRDAGVVNPDSNYIKLKVIGQDTNEVHFRIKRTAKFLRLMTTYSEKVGAPLRSLRFLFDGIRVHSDDTPEKLDMEEDDTIEVHQEMSGGNNDGDISEIIFI